MRRLFPYLLALLVCFGAATAMTWPLAIRLDRAISDPADPYFNTWAMDWTFFATFHHHALFQANIFYPARYAFAFGEHIYGVAMWFFPLFAAGVAPLTIHNLAILVGFALCGYAMFLLAYETVRSWPAAICGAIAYAFVGFRFHHLPHVQVVWSFGLPLVLLAIIKLREHPTALRAVWLALALIVNGLTSLHWMLFGFIACGLTIAAALPSLKRGEAVRLLVLAGGAVAASLLVLMPFTQPYMTVAKLYGMRRLYADALPNSAQWLDWLTPNYQNKLYGNHSPQAAYSHERTLFPGLLTLLLAIIGTVAISREERRTLDDSRIGKALSAAIAVLAAVVATCSLLGRNATVPLLLLAITLAAAIALRLPWHVPFHVSSALLWIAIGALGARGLNGFFHSFLFDHFGPARSIRMPVRWVMVAFVGVSQMVAYGTAFVLSRRATTSRVLIGSAIATALLFELRVAPIRWYMAPMQPRPIYDWIAATPIRGAVLELPMTQTAAYEYLWRATRHHKPLINGVSSYTPPTYSALEAMYGGPSDAISADFLHELVRDNCSLIVVHEGLLRDRSSAVRQWLRTAVSQGDMQFIRRFDAGAAGDYVFALPRVEPAASRWRAPDVRDASGRTPAGNLDVFLTKGGPTYNNGIFANVDYGPAGNERGPLTVSGWALAPAGISSVRLLFDNERVSVPATLTPRDDVKAVYPWYPRTQMPGFTCTLPAPPRGIDGDTDMQLEVTDAVGARLVTPPFWFRWSSKVLVPAEWRPNELRALLERLHANPETVQPRVVSGTRSVQDYLPSLMSDPFIEPNSAFVSRCLEMLFGGPPDPVLASRYLRLLTNHASREDVLRAMYTSREFRQKYLVSGRVTVEDTPLRF